MAQVEIYSSFRPGDLVRAQVVSLGDSRSYFLSTARNDCGVVYAKSTSGKQCSWRPSISDWCTVFRLAHPLRGLAAACGRKPAESWSHKLLLGISHRVCHFAAEHQFHHLGAFPSRLIKKSLQWDFRQELEPYLAG